MTYEFDASEYEQDIDLSDEADLNEDSLIFWQDCGMPAPALIHFHYKNDLGHETERVVEVQRFTDHSSGLSVLGHCRLRNAIREFRIEWMTRCVDEQTGKPIEDIYEYLFDLYEQAPDYSLDQVLADHGDTLRALAYVLSAGDRWQSHGQAVIGIACRKLSGDARVTDAMLAPHLESISGDSVQAYRMVIGRLNKALSTDAKSAVARLATKVANLGGQVSDPEKEALDYMAQRFAKSE